MWRFTSDDAGFIMGQKLWVSVGLAMGYSDCGSSRHFLIAIEYTVGGGSLWSGYEGSHEGDTMEISLSVNGQSVTGETEPRTLLVHFIREQLRLTGTHVGCETSYCGACTIHVDGKAVKSCAMLAVQANGLNITTIEGMADGDNLHPVQEGFWERHGLQCGFCTPGMVMSSAALIADNPAPSEEEIRHGIEGNLCRCTGYHNIVKAVEYAAATSRGEDPPAAEWENS